MNITHNRISVRPAAAMCVIPVLLCTHSVLPVMGATQDLSLYETLEKYDFAPRFLQKHQKDHKFSSWALTNKGRMSWIMMTTNRDPLKTGAALMDIDSYCSAFLAMILDVNSDMDVSVVLERLNELSETDISVTFDSTIETLLLEAEEDKSVEDLTEILIADAGLDSSADVQFIGTDMLYGLCFTESAAGEAKPLSDDTLLFLKTTSYKEMHDLSEPDSAVYAYLEEQLERLKKCENGEITMPISFEEFSGQETSDSENDKKKLPFTIKEIDGDSEEENSTAD